MSSVLVPSALSVDATMSWLGAGPGSCDAAQYTAAAPAASRATPAIAPTNFTLQLGAFGSLMSLYAFTSSAILAIAPRLYRGGLMKVGGGTLPPALHDLAAEPLARFRGFLEVQVHAREEPVERVHQRSSRSMLSVTDSSFLPPCRARSASRASAAA